MMGGTENMTQFVRRRCYRFLHFRKRSLPDHASSPNQSIVDLSFRRVPRLHAGGLADIFTNTNWVRCIINAGSPFFPQTEHIIVVHKRMQPIRTGMMSVKSCCSIVRIGARTAFFSLRFRLILKGSACFHPKRDGRQIAAFQRRTLLKLPRECINRRYRQCSTQSNRFKGGIHFRISHSCICTEFHRKP